MTSILASGGQLPPEGLSNGQYVFKIQNGVLGVFTGATLVCEIFNDGGNQCQMHKLGSLQVLNNGVVIYDSETSELGYAGGSFLYLTETGHVQICLPLPDGTPIWDNGRLLYLEDQISRSLSINSASLREAARRYPPTPPLLRSDRTTTGVQKIPDLTDQDEAPLQVKAAGARRDR